MVFGWGRKTRRQPVVELERRNAHLEMVNADLQDELRKVEGARRHLSGKLDGLDAAARGREEQFDLVRSAQQHLLAQVRATADERLAALRRVEGERDALAQELHDLRTTVSDSLRVISDNLESLRSTPEKPAAGHDMGPDVTFPF